jgi:MFS transporter, OFA family, oxalate/formate antiporter
MGATDVEKRAQQQGREAGSTRGKPRKLFYGWIVAFTAGLGIACSVAVFIPSTAGLLVGVLSKDLGWSATGIYFGVTCANIMTIFVAPFLGAIVDRFGARRVIGVSFVIEALILASFYFLGTNIFWFYVRYALLAALATGTTAIPFARVISRWFDRRRGLALGVALSATGVGGAIFSLLVQLLIEHVGWRLAFVCVAALIGFVVLPIIMLLLRESPESMGLHVDGAAEAPNKQAGSPEAEGMTLGQAMRGSQYWLIALSFILVAFAIQTMMVHLVPILRSQGMAPGQAATVQASLWVALVFGRVASGWLIDRIFAPRVAFLFVIPCVIGILMLISGVHGITAFIAAMLIGMANGSEAQVIPYLTCKYYGLKHFTQIYATFFSCYCLGAGLGPPIVANLVEKGGYFGAMKLLIVVVVLGGLVFLTYRRFPKQQTA